MSEDMGCLGGGNGKVVKLDRTDSCINSLIIDNHWVILIER